MKKFFCLLGLLLVFSTSVFAETPKKLIVLLDWFANPNHAPLFVAQAQGFFKEQGLEIEIIGPADPTDPPKLVAAGKADIAITYQPQFMQQVDQGLPLIRIGTLIDRPLTCLVVLKNGPVKTIADLKTKSIGYSGDTNSITLKAMLNKNKISTQDVQLINVHYDLTQALLSKKVSAVTGMMRNFELIQMKLLGYPGKAFYPEQHGVPTYSELIFVANKTKSQDPRLKKFILAVKKGVSYLNKYPTQSWELFVKNHPELNDELNKQAWVETLPYFCQNPSAFNSTQWLQFGTFLLENGLVKKIQPITMYAIDLNQMEQPQI